MRTASEGFAYDAWANALWEEAIGNSRQPELYAKVVEHMQFAQQIWLKRVNESMNSDWSSWPDAVDAVAPESIIEYRSLTGDAFTSSFDQIAFHVLNHGTYHRGHLRMIAEANGDAWPETDLIKFYRDR